jgi:hypothetical protein
LLSLAASVPELLRHRAELVEYWLPRHDEEAKRSGGDGFMARWEKTVHEVRQQMRQLAPLTRRLFSAAAHESGPDSSEPGEHVRASYEEIIALLQLRDPARRGSGTATALAALAVATSMADRPAMAVLLTCQALDTDTDTIATMVGALVGVTAQSPPPHIETKDSDQNPLRTADIEYQVHLAQRCAALARGVEPTVTFTYPDLLTWVPPKTQLDAVGLRAGRRVLAGIGYVEPVGPSEVDQRGNIWQWHVLDFGQHVLLKMRAKPKEITDSQLPIQSQPDMDMPVTPHDAATNSLTRAHATDRRRDERRRRNALAHLNDGDRETRTGQDLRLPSVSSDPSRSDQGVDGTAAPRPIDVGELLNWVARNNYDDRSIAYFVRRLAETAPSDDYRAALSLLRDRLQERGRPGASR